MNKQDPKEIIIQILGIVGYGENKEGFADQLLSVCQQQALVDLTNSLAAEKQTLLRETLSKQNDPKTVISLLKQHFSQEQSSEALRQATEKIISDYIQTVYPKLSDTQRNNLQTYMQSIA